MSPAGGISKHNVYATLEERCIQFPGRFHPKHVDRLAKRVKRWRQDARARGVVIGPLKYPCPVKKPGGRGPDPQWFRAHWAEMLQYLEAHPDQTAMELLTEIQARYPGFYSRCHLRTLRRRVQVWRRQAIQRLICEMKVLTQDVTVSPTEQSCGPNQPLLSNPELLPVLRAVSLPCVEKGK